MQAVTWALLCAPVRTLTFDVQAPHCPPPMHAREPGDCVRAIHQTGGNSFIRSLFDHAARVFQPLIDIIELLPEDETMDEDHLALMHFLNSVLHVLCVMDWGHCYESSIRDEVIVRACDEVHWRCKQINMCSNEGYVCQWIHDGAGAPLGHMLEDLRKIVVGWAEQRGMEASIPPWQIKEGEEVADCVVRAPRRILLLNKTLLSLEPEGRELFTRHRILELAPLGLLPASGFSSYVINLGAGYLNGCLDSANCLVDQGWPGILLEVDSTRADFLRSRCAHRQDVQVLSNLIRPSEFSAAVLSAIWNRERSLPPTDLPFPMFFKIDVDNGDCEYLEAWLSTGYRPLFVELELIQSFVSPDLEVNFPFSLETYQQQCNLGSSTCTSGPTVLHGCSLGAVMSIFNGLYSLFSWSYDKELSAQFVLTSWANEQNLTAIPPEDIEEFWRHAVSQRELWDDHNWHGLEFPMALMVDLKLQAEDKRRLVTDSWASLRSRLSGEIPTRSFADEDAVRVRENPLNQVNASNSFQGLIEIASDWSL